MLILTPLVTIDFLLSQCYYCDTVKFMAECDVPVLDNYVCLSRKKTGANDFRVC
jgi:hypothetical protein